MNCCRRFHFIWAFSTYLHCCRRCQGRDHGTFVPNRPIEVHIQSLQHIQVGIAEVFRSFRLDKRTQRHHSIRDTNRLRRMAMDCTDLVGTRSLALVDTQRMGRLNSLAGRNSLAHDSIHHKGLRHHTFRCTDRYICCWCTLSSDCIRCSVCTRADNRRTDRPNIPWCMCRWHYHIVHWRHMETVRRDCTLVAAHHVRRFPHTEWMDRRCNEGDTCSLVCDFERGILRL